MRRNARTTCVCIWRASAPRASGGVSSCSIRTSARRRHRGDVGVVREVYKRSYARSADRESVAAHAKKLNAEEVKEGRADVTGTLNNPNILLCGFQTLAVRAPNSA